MLKNGINLQVHYIPIHLQKYYKEKFNFPKKKLIAGSRKILLEGCIATNLLLFG